MYVFTRLSVLYSQSRFSWLLRQQLAKLALSEELLAELTRARIGFADRQAQTGTGSAVRYSHLRVVYILESSVLLTARRMTLLIPMTSTIIIIAHITVLADGELSTSHRVRQKTCTQS